MESPSPSASFRFVDLPVEIRIQIYRIFLRRHGQDVMIARNRFEAGSKIMDLAIVSVSRLIYSEAMPLFLSENHFFIYGTRWEHTWPRRMRPEGRSELRKVTFTTVSTVWSHHYSVYNALSLCTQLRLTLRIRSSRQLAGWILESRDHQRNMHGFAAATSNAPLKETDLCRFHQHNGVPDMDMTPRWELVQRVEELLKQYRAPCIGKCRVHKGREGTHTQATIYLHVDSACYYC